MKRTILSLIAAAAMALSGIGASAQPQAPQGRPQAPQGNPQAPAMPWPPQGWVMPQPKQPEHVALPYKQIPLVKSQWEGARVAILGDSITDANQIGNRNNIYWNNLIDILGIEPYCYGINGHKMNQIIGQGERLEREHGQAVDAILVFIGTNDYNGNVPLGEWYTYSNGIANKNGKDTALRHRELVFDDATFRGRTNTTVRWLKTHYPDKQIIFLTPIHRGYAMFGGANIQPPEDYSNACGSFVDEYIQAVKEISNVWAVPVIDLNAVSGLYPLLDEHTRYFRNAENDRLHPNTPGQLRMAYAIAYQLLGYPARFDKFIALGFDSNSSKVKDLLKQTGVSASFGADLDGAGRFDWGEASSAEERAAKLVDSVRNGDIICLPDTDASTLEALKTAIPQLKDNGFTFVTVPELFAVRGVAPRAADGMTNVY